jgi:hypothetical protein
MPPKETHILLLGRKGIVVTDAQSHLNDPTLIIHTGTSISDVITAFSTAKQQGYVIDHVFSGAGLDLDIRLEIVRTIFTESEGTSVHLKDAKSGPRGFLPFVKSVLEGLKTEESGQ